MLAARIDRPSELTARNGILVLSGYGIRIFVERGHLTIEDGIADERRRGRFPRPNPGFKRVVVIGHTGIVTLEALRWLHDVGVPFIQIDADGQVINCAGPAGLNDSRLRRAQALASDPGFGNGTGNDSGTRTGTGFGIARDLIKQKLAGQLRVLEGFRDKPAIQTLRSAIERIQAVESIDKLRYLEGEAAIAYWGAWRDIDVVFVERDRDRVPEHWLTFGVRRSFITQNPRKATNPANAILNYLYAILEAEARIAALTMGLDPGMGVMHADQRGRDSLSCDLMEAVRPAVDAYVLELLHRRAFKKSNFFETREGVCRLMPTLSKQLAETGSLWAEELAPVTESVAKRFHGTGFNLATPLTRANRSAGRAGYMNRHKGAGKRSKVPIC
jgi:CRISPR-associated endonuclease Cas1